MRFGPSARVRARHALFAHDVADASPGRGDALPFQGGLDLPGAVAFAAVAPDRAHVAGDRIRTLGFGMPGHPVTGGAGNARYPASRRYRVAGGVGPYHACLRANTGAACSETSASISNCLLRLPGSISSFRPGVRLSAARVEPLSRMPCTQRRGVDRAMPCPALISRDGLPLSHDCTICRLNASSWWRGCFGSAIVGLQSHVIRPSSDCLIHCSQSTRDRLLRRAFRRVDDRHQPERGVGQRHARRVCSTLKDGEKPIIHSDRGCHYRWPEWIRICKEHGLTRSMSAKGCSPDNAAAEGFFGRLKQEFFHERSFAGVSMDGFVDMLDGYMVWYRDKRIKTEFGHGHHGPSTRARSCGMIGGDGINDESNKMSPAPSGWWVSDW